MGVPPLPAGYNVAKHVLAGRPDCLITVGFDRDRSQIPRFLVQLYHRTTENPSRWIAIARMDHNETATTGHDVYREGLHVDVERRSKLPVQLRVPHGPLPENRGTIIRECAGYLASEASYFLDVYEERRPPGRPPHWSPDGGDSGGTFIGSNRVEGGMSEESPVEGALSLEELSEVLAEATGATPEAIERGARGLEIAPPREATVVGIGDGGPSAGSADDG